MTLNDILYRDDALAKREAEAGMHHAGYWSAMIQKILFFVDQSHAPKATDYNSANGAHYFEFRDPVTGQTYDVRIKPRMEKKP